MIVFCHTVRLLASIGIACSTCRQTCTVRDRGPVYVEIQDQQNQTICPNETPTKDKSNNKIFKACLDVGKCCAQACHSDSATCTAFSVTAQPKRCFMYDFKPTNYIRNGNCISYRTNAMPYSPPVSYGGCNVDLRSFGNDDNSTMRSGFIKLNGYAFSTATCCGLRVVMLHFETCKRAGYHYFNTNSNSALEAPAFADYLNSMKDLDILLVITAAEYTHNLSPAYSAMTAFGMSGVGSAGWRDKGIMIGQKGRPSTVQYLKSDAAGTGNLNAGFRFQGGSSLTDVVITRTY